MKQITTKTPGEAWLKAASEVLKSGKPVKDGEQNLKEILNVMVTVRDSMGSDDILEKYADEKMIVWMKDNFLKTKQVLDWGYSYGQRFFSFDGINQIKKVIEKLSKNPESKSATITLMDPKGDGHHVPCIVAIDFKIRERKLMLTAFFRSQDVGKKMYADIISLGEIGKMISKEVKVELGDLNILIVSLHAYEADWDNIKKLVSENL